MFGFLSKKCDERALFGYVCISFSAEYRNHKKDNRAFDWKTIIMLTNTLLRTKNRTIDNAQKDKVDAAAKNVGHGILHSDPLLLKIAEKLALAQNAEGFDFTIPEVMNLHNYLTLKGVYFIF